jgi:tRNA pseudouridine38-40 synthase
MVLSYDGAAYGGWQKQTNSTSIQQTIEDKLRQLLATPTDVIGSGRTDAGVHAKGQVAHFCCEKEIDTKRLSYSLNCVLPKDIRILSLDKVDDNFHARFSAKKKIYHYHIRTDRISDPFKRKYSYHVLHKLCVDNMIRAASLLIGTHDFTSFANERGDSPKDRDNVRTLYRLDIIPEEGGFRLEFEGSGFLYKMVRNITGTLLEIGAGKRTPEEITTLLKAKDRKKGGKTAEGHGLFLVDVIY